MSKISRIGVIGDFDCSFRSHLATNEALSHSGQYLGLELEVCWVPTQTVLEHNTEQTLEMFDGLFCAPGSPYRSLEGALRAIKFARETNLPFIGT